ncbi:MAG: FAD-dependent oxidoreductase [Armatimonadota bacterium]|nr:FAD-dependent oxidoreductase [Armatimonadota bacterium]
MPTADAVVIGAGVIGASVAYHLAARGLRTVVVERAPGPGMGSTACATGGFRAQFTTEVNVRLSLLSRAKLLAFREETGVDPGYRPCGYLFIATSPDQMELLRAAVDVQRRAGLREVAEVCPEEIARIHPAVKLDRVTGGTFCPTDGFTKPTEILRGYLEAARRLGVEFVYGADARCVVTDGRIAGVRTDRTTIATACVVNAAGPWAGKVARQAGVAIPVHPVRRQVAVTHPFGGLPEHMPMTIFVEDGFHLRVRDGRVLLLWPADLPSDDPFDTTFDERWLDGVMVRARTRLLCLAEAEIDLERCWAGLYEMSPDRHVILGPAPGLAGLYLVNGSSGHGVMHAPALGQLVAEVVTDGEATSLDIRPLRATRFAEGDLNPESGVL